MDDTEIHRHIDELVAEEHKLERAHIGQGALRRRAGAAGASSSVQLDRYWDLLRQRDARRRAGLDPDAAQERSGQRGGGLPPVAQRAPGAAVIGRVLVTPTSRAALAEEVVELVAGPAGPACGWPGRPGARPGPVELAERVATALRAGAGPRWWSTPPTSSAPPPCAWRQGRRTRTRCCDGWLDEAALRREVLDPAAPGRLGPGAAPAVERGRTDRAYRDGYTDAPRQRGGAAHGALLLGRGLPAGAGGALPDERRPPSPATLPAEDLRWTVPAHVRYEQGAGADLLVLADHPDRPAVQRTR